VTLAFNLGKFPYL